MAIPRQVVLDNRTDFAGKLERLLGATLQIIDTPGQLYIDLASTVAIAPVPDSVEMELNLDVALAATA